MAANPRLLVGDSAAVESVPPSPPYRRFPSSSEPDIHSPPYRSRSQVGLMGETEKLRDDQCVSDEKKDRIFGDADDAKAQNARATVHYSDNVSPGAEHSHTSKPVKFDSSEPTSRAPSLAPSEDEYDEDNYDWSTEDDLEMEDETKKFEKQMGVKQERSRFMKVVNFFLSTLIGSTITSGVIVGIALTVHFLYYKHSNDSNREKRKFVTENVQAWLFWAAANLTISWALAFLINIVPGVVTWVIFIIWGHISESMKTRVELYHSVKDTIKPVFYAASAWLSWFILFASIYSLYNNEDEDASRASYTPRVYQVIQFIFFFVLVLSLQKMLSHMIAFAFHRTAFKDRLESLQFALNTIDHLKNYKPKHRPERSSKVFSGFSTKGAFGFRSSTPTPYDEKSHFMSNVSRISTPDPYDDGHAGDTEDNSTSSKKGKGKQRHTRVKITNSNGSPTESRPDSPANTQSGHLATHSHDSHTYPPRNSRPATPVRKNSDSADGHVVMQAGKALKKAVLSDARNMTGKGDEEGVSGLGWTVGSTEEAKRIARSIYLAFKGDKRRTYLVPEDFYPAYPNHDEALTAFRVFDTDHNGDITRVEIKRTIVQTYRERRFLSRSMRDVGEALRSLDHVLLFAAFIILFFISLSVFGVEIGKSLSSVYTLGIAASFIFKNTAKNIFDAIMFLFVTHPYDTGDRCFIDEENLVVKKISLLVTVFTRVDGSETYYFNSQLFGKFITNARRSDKTAELCTLFIDWRTPLEKIDALEHNLNDWLATEENRWFEPSTSITLQKIEFQRYLEISIGIPHNESWQDWGLRVARKTAFYAAATYYCRQLDITYYLSPMPITWAGHHDAAPQPTSPTMNEFDDTISMTKEDVKEDAKDMKPMLGFLPPPEKRDAHLLRARKSRTSKKGTFRAMDG